MVIRGKARGNGRQLGHYLLSTKENEWVRVIQIRGTASQDLVKACVEMNLTSELTKTDKGIYHSQMNPAIGEDNLTDEQWIDGADILDEEIELHGKRALVLHFKNNRHHLHLVYERYDYEKGKMISDSHNFKKHDKARQRIEEKFLMKKTPLKNLKGPEIRKKVTELWNGSKTAEGFMQKVATEGMRVVRSDNRRPFMIVDESGRSYDLVRHLEKVKTAEVRDRFKGISLPSDREAIADIRAKQNEKKLNRTQDNILDSLEAFRKRDNDLEI